MNVLKNIGLVCATTVLSMLLGLGGSYEIHAEEVESTPSVASEFVTRSVPTISIPLDQKTRITMDGISQINGVNDGHIVDNYFNYNLSFNDVQGWTYQDFMKEYVSGTSPTDALITVSNFINGIIDEETALERLKEYVPLAQFQTIEQVQEWLDVFFSPYVGKSIQSQELIALMNSPIEIIDDPDSLGKLKVKNPLVYNFIDNNVNVKIHYVYSDGLQVLEDRDLTAYKGAASVTIDSPIIEEYEADQKSIKIDFIQEGLMEYTVTYYKPGEVPQLGAQVTVQYVDENGNEIADPVTLSGNIGEDYITEQKEIAGYSFKEVLGNSSGVFGEEAQVITYVYSKDPVKGTNVVVHYQDEEGNKLAKDKILSGNVGEAYIAEQKEIPGYSFKGVQGNTSGVFGEEAQEITYIYKKDLVISGNGNRPDNGTTKEKPDVSTLTQHSLAIVTKEENSLWYGGHQNHFLPSTGEKPNMRTTILGGLLLGFLGTITYHKKRKGSKKML